MGELRRDGVGGGGEEAESSEHRTHGIPPGEGECTACGFGLNDLRSQLVSVVEPWRYAVPTQNNMAHHLRSPWQ